MLAKLPFSIRDSDIDVEEPVNIDATCKDEDLIRDLQRRQADGLFEADRAARTSVSHEQALSAGRLTSPDDCRAASPQGVSHTVCRNVCTGGLHRSPALAPLMNGSGRFTGPGAEVPSIEDVQSILADLNDWKHQEPVKYDETWIPQQPAARVQATYLQAVLVLLIPVLAQDVVELPLLSICADFAAEACEVRI